MKRYVTAKRRDVVDGVVEVVDGVVAAADAAGGVRRLLGPDMVDTSGRAVAPAPHHVPRLRINVSGQSVVHKDGRYKAQDQRQWTAVRTPRGAACTSPRCVVPPWCAHSLMNVI